MLLTSKSNQHLKGAIDALVKVKEWNLENVNSALSYLIQEKEFKTGEFYMDLRICLTGSKFTPPINDSMIILGKEETLKRLKGID